MLLYRLEWPNWECRSRHVYRLHLPSPSNSHSPTRGSTVFGKNCRQQNRTKTNRQAKQRPILKSKMIDWRRTQRSLIQYPKGNLVKVSSPTLYTRVLSTTSQAFSPKLTRFTLPLSLSLSLSLLCYFSTRKELLLCKISSLPSLFSILFQFHFMRISFYKIVISVWFPRK